MNPILEQVARAICKAEGLDPDGKETTIMLGNGVYAFKYFWEKKVPLAKTAVQALIDAEWFDYGPLKPYEIPNGMREQAEAKAMLKQIIE